MVRLSAKAMKKVREEWIDQCETDASSSATVEEERVVEIMKKKRSHPGKGWAGDLHDGRDPE